MAYDLNEIKARIEGSQRWKLFRGLYKERFPDDRFDLDNEPPETLAEKLKERGYENPNELLAAREDFRAEQNALGAPQEDKEEKPKEKENKDKDHLSHRSHQHGHEITHDEFEEAANTRAQEAADEWDKTKDLTKAKNRQDAFSKVKQAHYDEFVSKNLSLAHSWSQNLATKKQRNEHLVKAVEKELQKRANGAQKDSVHREQAIRPAGPISMPSIPRTPSISWAPRRPSVSFPSPRTRWTGAGRNPAAQRLSGLARGMGRKLLKKGATTALKRAALTVLLGNPISLLIIVIVGFFALLIIIVLIILFFFFGAGSTTARPANLPVGIDYSIWASPVVANGEDIEYQIYFTYDSLGSNLPEITDLSIIDNIPIDASFRSATDPHTCDPACDSTAQTVTWKISDLDPYSTDGSISNYKFEITLHPENNNVVIVNSICLGVEGEPPICPDTVGEDPGPDLPAPSVPPCGNELDRELEDLNIITNVTICEKKKIIYESASRFLSYPNLEAKFGTEALEIKNGTGDAKCGNDTNWRACTRRSGVTLKNFETTNYDDYWRYAIIHELFHVLQKRDSSIFNSYRGLLPSLQRDDASCYRDVPGGKVIKTYELETYSFDESAHESYAESGALFITGGRGSLSSFGTQCDNNNTFWDQKI